MVIGAGFEKVTAAPHGDAEAEADGVGVAGGGVGVIGGGVGVTVAATVAEGDAVGVGEAIPAGARSRTAACASPVPPVAIHPTSCTMFEAGGVLPGAGGAGFVKVKVPLPLALVVAVPCKTPSRKIWPVSLAGSLVAMTMTVPTGFTN